MVKVWVGSDMKVSGSYDSGYLYGLVKGDVKFSAPLNVKLKVDALRMAIKINSVQTYGGSWPFNKDDKLTMHMSTTPMSLDHFTQQLQDGGLGIDYSGSRYVSQFFGIEQDFSDAVFYIVRKDQGWSFEGTYLTEMTKWGTTLYAKGFVSNVAQDNTAYYCDADLTTHIGTAWHALELTDGYFEFADGTRFTYGLSAY